MGNIRAVIRLTLFAFISFISALFVVAGRLLLFNWNNYYQSWKGAVKKTYARIIMLLIGMELEIKGSCPDPPFFLVSNHLSYIDILPLWYCCKGTFIAKSEVSNWPFFGLGAKILGVIFINREKHRDIKRVNNIISKEISEGQGIMLFPEGTSTKGTDILPFKPSLLFFPANKKFPVSYASIFYSTHKIEKPASKYVCWWGGMTFLSHFFELLKFKKFQAKITFGDEPVVKNNRKILAGILHQKVENIFKPVT